MLNIDEFFKVNKNLSKKQKNIQLIRGHACIKIECNKNVFTGDELLDVIHGINYVINHYPKNIPILLDLGEFEFADKLVYILLECVVDYLIENLKQEIFVIMKANHNILSEGIKNSPILAIKHKNKKTYIEFIKNFKFSLSMTHYRKLLVYDDKSRKFERALSDLFMEVNSFLENNLVTENTCKELSEVIVELAGNALEHCESDCLVDLDITSEYEKTESNKKCYGLNVAIVNFSKLLFPYLLKDKMKLNIVLPDRYDIVKEAYKFHSRFFDNDYTEDDFFTLSSFQHKISGSTTKDQSGGVGLTTLLKSIEERAEDHMCYMLSGNRIFFFRPFFMKLNQDMIVGFNKSCDFIHGLPDSSLFKNINTYFPGTAYNLNFTISKGRKK